MSISTFLDRRRRRPRGLRTALAAATAVLLCALAACGGGQASSKGDREGTELTVLAAASLTDAFGEIGAVYEKEHPGTRIRFSFAGSQELAAQVRQGVPADVLVTADTATMDGLKGRTGTPSVIATNRLVMVTARGNPKRIGSLADLDRPGLKVVLAAPEVPAGRYARQALAAAGVTVKPASQEPNVRAVLSKVELGEADAGIVYTTDARAARGKVGTVAIPEADNVVAEYPAATLTHSRHPKQAAAFVAWLGSANARKILREAGFGGP